MKFIKLTCLFLATLGFQSRADAESWSDDVKCSEKASDLAWTQSGITEAKIRSILHPKPMVKTEKSLEVPCRLSALKWNGPNFNDGLVVAFETATFGPSGHGGYTETSREVALAVLSREKVDGSLKLAAMIEAPIHLSDRETFVSLDLANYKLSEAVKAIGLRTSKSVMYAGGGGASERLSLYVQEKANLRLVFKTVMSSAATIAGEWNQDGTRDHDQTETGPAVISVLKTNSNGYFDLEKRLKNSPKKRAIFKWNGKMFETKDQDPAPDTIDED